MSHKHPEHITCPNCGFHATENFCARCGQPTHLHKDTFWGLAGHFIGHYFHYDSKFLQTLKALWFSPGKLTIAYHEKKRASYLPPISLYILISAIYFLTSSLLPNHNRNIVLNTGNDSTATNPKTVKLKKGNIHIGSFLSGLDQLRSTDEGAQRLKEAISEGVEHHTPKVFFFMIPVMALILQMFFSKHKDIFYVNHVIFALHFHSFWFSARLIQVIYPFDTGRSIVVFIATIVSAFYFIYALRRVYNITWGRSILYSCVTAIIYALFAAVAFVAVLGIILANQLPAS